MGTRNPVATTFLIQINLCLTKRLPIVYLLTVDIRKFEDFMRNDGH